MNRVLVAALLIATTATAVSAVGFSGELKEYYLSSPGLGLACIAAADNGTLWFTESSAEKVGYRRFGTGSSGNDFSVETSPGAITKGSDGNMWFTGIRSIGKITPNGEVSYFPVTGDFGDPFHTLSHEISCSAISMGAGTGRDDIWFAESPKVGRIDQNGRLYEYAFDQPHGITAGPDRVMWVASTGSIKRFNPSDPSAIQTFSLPSSSMLAFSIATGSDGNLWFTERSTFGGGNGKIGRITPAGVITEFPLSAGADPLNIAAGPDGNLWFTVTFGSGFGAKDHAIGRITRTGSVQEFPISDLPVPSGRNRARKYSDPTGIAAGSDGAIYFLEFLRNGNGLGDIVGRISLPPPPTATVTAPPTPTSSISPTVANSPTRTPSPTAGACPGDCNHDHTVTVDEIVKGSNIALGSLAVSECLAFDGNQDSMVTVDEIVRGVNNALNGCQDA